jgi:hypothetical protein
MAIWIFFSLKYGKSGPFFPRKSSCNTNFRQISTLKNMISTYTKDISWKKMARIREISNFKIPNFTESYDNFQKVAKNIEGFFNFF